MSGKLEYDYYAVLGISRKANVARIRQAYRKQVKFCHPDLNNSPNAAVAFNAVQQAYETLIQPERRKAYDEQLKQYTHTTSPDKQHSATARPQVNTEEAGEASRSFIALHLVGILFVVAVCLRCAVGILSEGWALYTLVYCVPVFILMPHALRGFASSFKSRYRSQKREHRQSAQ